MLTDAQTLQQLQAVRQSRLYPHLKRVLDVVLCMLLLPFVLIVTVIIAIVICVDSAGPIFFVQERVGQGGRRFNMYKFRTLRREHDQLGSREFMIAFVNGQIGQGDDTSEMVFKPIAKKEITRVGHFLRRTSLDELPQIINVFRGEMSLVGPRPNVPCEVEAYKDWHRQRLEVLPGITGLAQVRGRSSISFDAIVRHDIEYATQRCLRLDLQILWWTLVSVVAGKGAG